MTEHQLAIAQAAIEPGVTQREIGSRLGISQQAVSKTLAKPELKQIVEEVQAGFVQANARRAAGNLTQIIHSPNPKDKELRLKYSAEVARAMGILPSNGMSIFVQNIYNDNRSEGMPPEIAKLLGVRQEQVIDAEYEDVEK